MAVRAQSRKWRNFKRYLWFASAADIGVFKTCRGTVLTASTFLVAIASLVSFCFSSADIPSACNVSVEPFRIPHARSVVSSRPVRRTSEFLSGSVRSHKINTCACVGIPTMLMSCSFSTINGECNATGRDRSSTSPFPSDPPKTLITIVQPRPDIYKIAGGL